MIDKQDILAGIAEPIKRYNNKMATEFSDWQPLEEHLKNVAKISRSFAESFGADDWDYLARLCMI